MAFLTFAMLAMATLVIVPPGLMAAPLTAGAPQSFPLVICTGHGPAPSWGELTRKAPGRTSRHEAPCAFAGHAAAFQTPLLARLALPSTRPASLSKIPLFDLTPGRGLAAPPPPSRGPPDLVL